MEEHNSVSEHVVKMSGYVQHLKTLEYEIPDELAIDRVLQSLPPSYTQFVLNYKMHGMNKTLAEFLAMLTSVDICRGDDHQVHNCPKYIKDEQAGKHAGIEKGICDIHVIDVYLTRARSGTWVFDTGFVAHICNSPEELQNRRDLARDEVMMRVGNGNIVDVVAVGTLPLRLPSGLILKLNKFYFGPALSMNIISGSCII